MAEFLIVGQGSMGKRRVRCLLANGCQPQQIAVFDEREDRLAESQENYGVQPAQSLEAALQDPGIRAVLVSVPGAFHVRVCLAAARAGKHWFSEVPLSVNLDGLDELLDLTQKGLVGAPGCQVLFHPLAGALKDWSQAPETGKVLGASYAFGSYLPEWHPYEDYRKFYASNQAMGGGNLDVLAQELVWIRWILDQAITAVTCRSSKVGSLELAEGTPDHQEIILEFENSSMLSMHLDLHDRTHERLIRLYSESSTAKWSTLEDRVRIFREGEWTEELQPRDLEPETPYHREIGHFLSCIDGGGRWPVALSAARELAGGLLAVQKSAAEGRTVAIEEVLG